MCQKMTKILLFLLCVFRIASATVNDTAEFRSVPSGYWKISNTATTPVKCPYGTDSCLGGEFGGVVSCDNHFEGFMCAESVDGDYIDWTLRNAMPCDTKMVAISILLSLLLAIALPFYICCCIGVVRAKKGTNKTLELVSLKNTKSNSRIPSSRSLFSENDDSVECGRDGPMEFLDFTGANKLNDQSTALPITDEHNNQVLNFLVKLKILIFTVQVTCSLPNSLLTPLPEGTSQLLRIFSYMSWASLQALPLKCISAALNAQVVNYQSSVEIATIVPVMTFVVVLVLYFVHIELVYLIKTAKHFKILQKRLSIRYGTAICMFVYIVQGGVHGLLFGSFQCVNADPDGLVEGRQYVMRNDVSTSCTTATYRYGYLWAVVCVILFAVAVPVIQGIVLTFYKISVAKDQLQLTAPSPVPSSPRTPRTPRTVDDHWETGSMSSVSGEYSLVPTDTPSRSVLMQQQRDRRSGSVGSSGRRSRSSRVSVDQKKKQKDRLSQFYDAICVMHMAYKPDFKYFELVDHCARVFFMALLPVLSPNNTHAQMMIALVAAIGCLLHLVYARPYLLVDNQLLACVGMTQIVVVILGTLAIQIDAAGGYSDSLIIFDVIMAVSVLTTPLLFVWQVWIRDLSCMSRFKSKETVSETQLTNLKTAGKGGTVFSRETTPQRGSHHTPPYGTPRSALQMTPPQYSYSPTSCQPLLQSAGRPVSIQHQQRVMLQSQQHMEMDMHTSSSSWMDTPTSNLDQQVDMNGYNNTDYNTTLTDPYYELETTQVEPFLLPPPPPPTQFYRHESQQHVQPNQYQQQEQSQSMDQNGAYLEQYNYRQLQSHILSQQQERLQQQNQVEQHSEQQHQLQRRPESEQFLQLQQPPRFSSDRRHTPSGHHDRVTQNEFHATDRPCRTDSDSHPSNEDGYTTHSSQYRSNGSGSGSGSGGGSQRNTFRDSPRNMSPPPPFPRALPPTPRHRQSTSQVSADSLLSDTTRPASASVNYDMYYKHSPRQVQASGKTFYDNPFCGDERSVESTPPTSSNASGEQTMLMHARQAVLNNQRDSRQLPPPLALDRPLKHTSPVKAPLQKQSPQDYSPPHQQDKRALAVEQQRYSAYHEDDENESVYAQFGDSWHGENVQEPVVSKQSEPERVDKPSLQQHAHALTQLSRAKSFSSNFRKTSSTSDFAAIEVKTSKSAKTTSSAAVLTAKETKSSNMFRMPYFFRSPVKEQSDDNSPDSPAMVALFNPKSGGMQNAHAAIPRDDDVHSALSGSEYGDAMHGPGQGGQFNPADCFDEMLEECLETERQMDMDFGYQQQQEDDEECEDDEQQYYRKRDAQSVQETVATVLFSTPPERPPQPVEPTVIRLNCVDDHQAGEEQHVRTQRTNGSRQVEMDTKRKQASEVRKSAPVVPTVKPSATVPLTSSVSQKVRRIESSVKQVAEQKVLTSPISRHGKSFSQESGSGEHSAINSSKNDESEILPSLEVDTRNVHIRSEVNEETGRVERYRYNGKSSKYSTTKDSSNTASTRSTEHSEIDFDLPSDTSQ